MVYLLELLYKLVDINQFTIKNLTTPYVGLLDI